MSQPAKTPDFVWVGCADCWQPKDRTRPVIFYADWEADPMRHRPFTCRTCSENTRRHVEVFPSLFGFDLEQGYVYREGQEIPSATTVTKYAG